MLRLKLNFTAMKKIELDAKFSKSLEDFAFSKIKTRSLSFTPSA